MHRDPNADLEPLTQSGAEAQGTTSQRNVLRSLDDQEREVLAYHQRTKHARGHYAASLGYLDWASQPNPFLRYKGAERLHLTRDLPELPLRFDELYAGAQTCSPVDAAHVSRFLYNSLAISAWKQVGQSFWSLRVNPSSGNLHPTECYLMLGAGHGLARHPALFHYNAFEHCLERRAHYTEEAWSPIARALPRGACLVALTSIVWREAWKYGERAFRYCQHDVGHALAALSLAAAAEGWHLTPVSGAHSREISAWLGLRDDEEHEAQHPDLLLCLSPMRPPATVSFPTLSLATPRDVTWFGRPQPLSSEHHEWPVLRHIAAVLSEAEPPAVIAHGDNDPPHLTVRALGAQPVLRCRRSAVDMDAQTPMRQADFLRICERLMPRAEQRPWSTLRAHPRMHLVFMIHRVEGVTPGTYLLCRNAAHLHNIAASLTTPLTLYIPDGASDYAPLFALRFGDFRAHARDLCCDQDIAADGAFAVAMVASLPRALAEQGPQAYCDLHWEAGAIGQVLYLEATAAGLAGTGIGCFHDDQLESACGTSLGDLSMIYGFVVGRPVPDTRLQTHPPYFHLDRKVSRSLH